MIPRLRPRLGFAELMAACWPSDGAVAQFEREFATLMKAKHATAFPYGRTGLLFLFQALGLRGKEIICPAYTCVVVPHAVVLSGNEPVFIDSRPEDFNMDLDAARQAINDNTGAIIATSIFGYPVDLDKLRDIKRAYPHIRIIQDCAHSFAAEWHGEAVQRCGDAAIFGLNISKTITSIFGGMITTDDDQLAERLRLLRIEHIAEPTRQKAFGRNLYLLAASAALHPFFYGLVNKLERSSLLDNVVKYYDEAKIDMPSDYLVGLTTTEAQVGLVQTKRYNEIVENRRQAAEYYDARLNDIAALTLPPLITGATYSHYVPRTAKKAELLSYALKHGVQLGELIEYSIPEMTAYRGRPGNRYPCPVAGEASRTAVNLPVWSGRRSDWDRVIQVVHGFFTG